MRLKLGIRPSASVFVLVFNELMVLKNQRMVLGGVRGGGRRVRSKQC
jgi:hypothetical protein